MVEWYFDTQYPHCRRARCAHATPTSTVRPAAEGEEGSARGYPRRRERGDRGWEQERRWVIDATSLVKWSVNEGILDKARDTRHVEMTVLFVYCVGSCTRGRLQIGKICMRTLFTYPSNTTSPRFFCDRNIHVLVWRALADFGLWWGVKNWGFRGG